MRITVLTTIAIAAVSLATTQPSAAQDSSTINAPVSVVTCDVIDTYRSAPWGEGVDLVPTSATVRVAFVNRSDRTVNDVTFVLAGRGGDLRIADEGRFSSGVQILHTFGPFDVDAIGPNASCDVNVTSVTFDNGVVWRRA
ncbi:MAG: hypothetical protein JWN27_1908 [Candidatus Eremiobacteraeota bacterium]|nr:hypothetical protein [Candidatus Eremiobacteraeota bacterium]